MALAIRVEELGDTVRGGGGIWEHGLEERWRGGGAGEEGSKEGRITRQWRRFWWGGVGGDRCCSWNLEQDEKWKTHHMSVSGMGKLSRA
jgi:hypothetical protein